MSAAVSVFAYARSHTAVYVSDKLRNFLKILVRHYGLDPQGVVDAWSSWVDRAARTWLESGHLQGIVIEFYKPGSDTAAARWDFPIRYDGNGVDEMWIDRRFFEDSLQKATTPPPGCSYRIALQTSPGEPHVDGVGSITLRSIAGLMGREVGTVIATPDLMASARYYRS
jgi:Bacterial HORMA domain 2